MLMKVFSFSESLFCTSESLCVVYVCESMIYMSVRLYFLFCPSVRVCFAC